MTKFRRVIHLHFSYRYLRTHPDSGSRYDEVRGWKWGNGWLNEKRGSRTQGLSTSEHAASLTVHSYSRDREDGEDDNEVGLNQPFTPVWLRLSVMFLLLVHLLRPGRRINPRSGKARRYAPAAPPALDGTDEISPLSARRNGSK
jgi:hypothetical protein